MSKLSELPSLEQVEAESRKRAVEEARSWVRMARSNRDERIAKAKQVREALIKLEAAGIVIDDDDLVYSTWAQLDLGFFPNTKTGNAALASAVREIRIALGCSLRLAEKEVADSAKKTVKFILRPVDYSAVKVTFQRKLPKSAKCRIVRQRSSYSALVCDV